MKNFLNYIKKSSESITPDFGKYTEVLKEISYSANSKHYKHYKFKDPKLKKYKIVVTRSEYGGDNDYKYVIHGAKGTFVMYDGYDAIDVVRKDSGAF